jgi:hypothetical protein
MLLHYKQTLITLLNKITADYSENHVKPVDIINTFCGQNTEFLNVEAYGTYNHHSALSS